MPQLTTHTARLFLILATVALTAVLVLALPQSVEAQGGWFQDAGCEGADCQLCHLVEVSNSIIIWVIGVLFVIFAVIMAVVGFQLVTSAGTAAAKQAAKSRFINAIIGFIIVLAAWLIIDTIMRALLAGGEGRVDGRFFWAEVQCLDVQRPTAGTPDEFELTNETYELDADGNSAEMLIQTGAGGAVTGSPQAPATGNLVSYAGYQFDSSIVGLVEEIATTNGLRVSSGYRSVERNRQVGGVANSYHLTGRAADFVGTQAQMQAGAAQARANGCRSLIHNVTSGVHLHIECP